MAGELTSFGIQKLWGLLSQECERFQGVEDEVKKLISDLNLLSSFLKDADAKKHTMAVVRNCVEEVKEIVYDAEDIIETYLYKEKHGKAGTKNRIRRLACIIPDRRRYALEIGGISKRISKVIDDMQHFGVQQIIVQSVVDGGYIPQHLRGRHTFPNDHESNFVALEGNVKTLVGYLVERDDIQIVSVTGMGGLGKTTLARHVFNHEDVKHQFDKLAWVCVTQEFTRISVWQTILQNLTSKNSKEEIMMMTEVELQGELFQLLETSKSLIIFDDIWKEEDWDEIRKIFPPKIGWKVLLTSRNDSVAMDDATHVNFKPEILTDQDSWTLFERIAMPTKDDSEYKVKEKLGKEMVKHCKGLPLAVKALGGLLNTAKTMHDWERLSDNIGSHVVNGRSGGTSGSVDCVLSTSFEELPSYLKHCFLYLAHFPEDYAIKVEDLTYYWAAEEIPRPRYYDGATNRQVADGYIEELVERNMVISKRDLNTSRFETCQLHDVMRDVCLLKAEEENFVHTIGIRASTSFSRSPCKSRRIVVHQLNETDDPKLEIQHPKLRSLLFIRKYSWTENKMASSLCFTRLQLMRVLDLSYAKFKGGKLPSCIGKLIHLRYLSLYWAEVTHLPSSMRNLKQLLYLNLYVSSKSTIYMPNIMKEMRELTYLCLPQNLDKTKLELGNLVNLETLYIFSTENSSVKDLQQMKKLRILIILRGKGCTNEALSSSLSELRHLEDLSIYDVRSGYVPTNDKEGIVLDFVHLKRLSLGMYMPRLSKQQHFPSHLTNLTLRSCRLEEDPMPILEKLFQLKEFELWDQSFSGKRLVCSSGGFPQLQKLQLSRLEEWEEWIVEEGSMPLLHSLEISRCPKLKKLHVGGFPHLHTLELYGLDEWEEWRVEEGSMPLLHSLYIQKCPKLKELPDGMRFIYSLKDLRIIGEEEEYWKERLSEGGEDYYKVKHIPSIITGLQMEYSTLDITMDRLFKRLEIAT